MSGVMKLKTLIKPSDELVKSNFVLQNIKETKLYIRPIKVNYDPRHTIEYLIFHNDKKEPCYSMLPTSVNNNKKNKLKLPPIYTSNQNSPKHSNNKKCQSRKQYNNLTIKFQYSLREVKKFKKKYS
jgi:hypothetical protein